MYAFPNRGSLTFSGIILDYAEVDFLLGQSRARLFEVGGTAKGPLMMPLLRPSILCMGRYCRRSTFNIWLENLQRL